MFQQRRIVQSGSATRQPDANRQRRRTRPTIGVILLIAMSAMPGGCTTAPGTIFEPVDPALRWPPSPEQPRIHFVGIIESEKDLRPGKGVFEGIGEALFGQAPTRSMLSPYALCSDNRGRLFVTDTNAQCIHVFDLERREYQQWGNDTEGPKLSQPVGLAYDPNGRLFVSDSVAGAILQFDDKGRFLGKIGAEHLVRPCGIGFDTYRERLFVADVGSHQVLVFDRNGQLQRRIGSRGVELGQFNFPTNVAIDGSGRLLVSDSLNFRVQVFDRYLNPLRQIGSKGDMPGYFAQPKGIAVDSEDHIYVVDAHFESVQIFDAAGNLLLAFGTEGNDRGEFWIPAGIHIDQDDRIWVADTYNRRVQVFDYRSETSP